jgi:hypothetical protein
MKRMKKPPVLAMTVMTTISLLALSTQSISAGEKPFAKLVPALAGAPPEGFTIGKGTTAYNGSIDGSIYKVNLQGDAYVFDADTGEQLKKYQLDDSGNSVINDLAITVDAVYFTDFYQPFLYRLAMSKNGRLPADANAATAIPLTGDFDLGDDPDNIGGIFANGIVATPDGKTLIVGHSGSSKIYKVDPATGYADEIIVSPPLAGLLDGSFLDAIVMYDGALYILSPGDTPDLDLIQVVVLSEDMLTGTLVGTIADPDMDGVASGAMHGDSLYVNNARYLEYPGLPTTYDITKIDIYSVQ